MLDGLDQVFRSAHEGRLEEAIESLVGRLTRLSPSPFRDAREANFDVPVGTVNRWLNEMATALAEQIDLRSIHIEMNGFDINPDRWFCGAMGYSTSIVVTNPFDDPKSAWYEELANIDAHVHWERDLTLTGMESMQRAFQWAADEGRLAEEGAKVSDWLVQCRFLALMRDGVAAGPLTPAVPLSAAAHESELALQFHPVSEA